MPLNSVESVAGTGFDGSRHSRRASGELHSSSAVPPQYVLPRGTRQEVNARLVWSSARHRQVCFA